ncbi:hypothetical protein AHAS_Ahas18G0069600 [Arachis hypogaea]
MSLLQPAACNCSIFLRTDQNLIYVYGLSGADLRPVRRNQFHLLVLQSKERCCTVVHVCNKFIDA